MGWLMALLFLVIGSALLVVGYRKARIVIPVWVFFSGFSAGLTIASNLSDTAVIGAFIGLGVGFVIGLALAVLSAMYYNIAIIALAALLGYWLGSSAMILLGIEPGFVSTVIGSVIGAIFGAGALLAKEPKYALITLTSFAGAVTVTGSFMILLGSISTDDLSYAANQRTISDAWLWLLFVTLSAATGMAVQAMLHPEFVFKTWSRGRHDDDSSGDGLQLGPTAPPPPSAPPSPPPPSMPPMSPPPMPYR